MQVATTDKGRTTAAAVDLRGVRRVFAASGAPVPALDGIDLHINPGEFVAILGPSGSGKSTLLRIIAGLDKPDAGVVEVSSRAPAYVFQDAHLLPWRNVLRNVELPLELMGVGPGDRSVAAREAVEQVGLSDAISRYPAQLSGGMRMRVSLARSLVTDPDLLLLDEPFAALDEITRHQLDEQLHQLWRARGMTVIFVTHSITEAAFLAQRAIVLTRRPARVILDHALNLPEHRTADLRGEPSFAAENRILLRADRRRREIAMRTAIRTWLGVILPPLVVLLVFTIAAEAILRWRNTPAFLVPRPSQVLQTAINDRDELSVSLWKTAQAALIGFGASTVVGVLIAVLLSTSRLVQRAFYPYTVFFQTVPIVAIAPLLVIWFDAGLRSVATCAFVVSVFPVIANTLAGLLSTDPALRDLFRLYGASAPATMFKLRLPYAMPNIVTGLRIAAGLAVIGTIVGEFFAGTIDADSQPLGILIAESKTLGRTDRVFAAVLTASLLGLVMLSAINVLGYIVLRHWHASEQE